jgi:GAF domain-containing protein
MTGTVSPAPANSRLTSSLASRSSSSRSQAITPVLKISCGMILAVMIVTFPANWQSKNWPLLILESASFIWLFLSAFVLSIPYKTRADGFLLILSGFGIYASVTNQSFIDNKVILACLIAAATIFAGRRIGLIVAILSIIVVVLFGWVSLTNWSTALPDERNATLYSWILDSAIFILISTLMWFILDRFSMNVEKETKVQHENQIRHLKQIEELDLSLKKMAKEFIRNEEMFETNSLFVHQFTSDALPEQTLQMIVQTIQEQFNYYYVGGYIIDEKKEFAVLKAATSTHNEPFLQRDLRIKLSEASVVSFAYSRAELRLSPNIPEETNFNTTPLLPGTKSELALPLLHNGEVIGVIDIQNDQFAAFSPSELKILKTYADQAAILFIKSSFHKQLLKAREELDDIYRQYTQKSWQSHLKQSSQRLAIRYRNDMLEKEAPQPIEAVQAISEGKLVLVTDKTMPGSTKASSTVTIPIKLRNQVIGALHIKLETEHLPDDWLNLMETISDRLAVALENARLLEEIQTSANREHLVSEISTKIRSSPNVDHVLRTAVSEIGQKLGVSEVLIHLHSDS